MNPADDPTHPIELAARTALTAPALETLAAQLPKEMADLMQEAVERYEGEAVQALCAAGLLDGHIPLDTRCLQAAIPMFTEMRVLASALGCMEPQAVQRGLVAVLRTEVPSTQQLGPLLLLLAYADLRRTGAILAQTVELAEWMALSLVERPLDPSWTVLLGLFQDPEFTTLLGPHHRTDHDGHAALIAESLGECFAHPTAFLDAAPLPPTTSQRTIGRNAPCPCGSGRRFKSCCGNESRDRLPASAGTGLVQRNQHTAAHLTPLDILTRRTDQLARLDIRHIPEHLQAAWVRRMITGRAWPALIQALRTLDNCDPLIAESADHAALLAAPEVTRKLIGLAEDRPLPIRLWTRMTLVSDPLEAVNLIEAATAKDLDRPPIETAYALLASPWPHLGMAVARGVLPLCTEEQALPMLDELLEHRMRMGQADWDPIEDVLLALLRPQEPASHRALQEAQAALADHQQTITEIEAQQQSLQREVQDLRDSAEHEDTLTREESDALRAQLHDLKQQLKQRHDERNSLRRALREAHREPSAPTQPAEAEPSADEGLEATWDGQLRLPAYTDAFADSIKRVPQGAARSAVQRLGEIAAGREGAFHDCRSLQGNPGLWRAKIGRSYRLLFRLQPEQVVAVDLIHRQDLEKRLRTLK